jgi:DNA-binding beta-propeller fold protein YncE
MVKPGAFIGAAVLVGIGVLGRGPELSAGSGVPTVYVSNDEGAVIPITLATNTAGKPISVGATGPIAITPDGKSAYVADVNGTVTHRPRPT